MYSQITCTVYNYFSRLTCNFVKIRFVEVSSNYMMEQGNLMNTTSCIACNSGSDCLKWTFYLYYTINIISVQKTTEEKESESQVRRSLVEASLNNIEVEILGTESTKAPDTKSSPRLPRLPSTPQTVATLQSSIQSPCAFSTSDAPLTCTPLVTANHSTPLQCRVTGISSESTSPVLPVIVGSNSEQQAIMMGRLMETVNLMQHKIERMEKQIQKLLAGKKV